jgi:hypothetical protein
LKKHNNSQKNSELTSKRAKSPGPVLLLDAKGPCLSRQVPSKKGVQRICRDISDETGRDKVWQDSKTVVDRLNRMMIGWANYFCLGPVRKAYSAVDLHARRRLRLWLCDKHKELRPAYQRFPEASLHSVYGLVRLPRRRVNAIVFASATRSISIV